MVQENDYVAIFHSIHKVMKAEKILKHEGAKILLIPVPRELTSDCGLAIRFSPEDWGQILRILAEADLMPPEIFRRKGKSFFPEDVRRTEN